MDQINDQALVSARISYGAAVRMARLSAGLTQLELALKLGLGRASKGSISNIEIGRRWPGEELAERIHQLLGVVVPAEREAGYSRDELDAIAKLNIDDSYDYDGSDDYDEDGSGGGDFAA